MTSPSHGPRWDVDLTEDERRAEIIRSLTDILRERQLSALTMQDIADRLGMAKGNLYNYFKNKQELLYQCHVTAMEGSFSILDEARKAHASSAERLRTLMVGLANSVTRDPYGAVLTTDLDSLTVQQRRRYVSLRDRFDDGVRAIVQEGIDRGEFAAADVKLTCFAMLGAVNWVSRWYKPSGPATPDQIGEGFADLFVRALRADVAAA